MMKWGTFLNINKIVNKRPEEYMEFVSTILKLGVIVAALCLACVITYVLDLFFWNNSSRLIDFSKWIIVFPTFLSLYVIYINSCIARFHEQGRIEYNKTVKAIELINKWNEILTPDIMHARSIVDKLDRDMSVKLFNKDDILIDIRDYKTFCALTKKDGVKERRKTYKKNKKNKKNNCCPHMDKCDASNQIKLNMVETILLRSLVMRYLNALEVIMYAWSVGAIDSEIIEKEFEYLVSSARDGSVVLKTFREAVGQENFPGIYAFCEYISDKQKKKINPKQIRG